MTRRVSADPLVVGHFLRASAAMDFNVRTGAELPGRRSIMRGAASRWWQILTFWTLATIDRRPAYTAAAASVAYLLILGLFLIREITDRRVGGPDLGA